MGNLILVLLVAIPHKNTKVTGDHCSQRYESHFPAFNDIFVISYLKCTYITLRKVEDLLEIPLFFWKSKKTKEKKKKNKKKGKQDFVLIDTLHLFSLKTRKFKQANEELISTKSFVTEKNRKPYGTFHQNPKTFS